MTEGNFKYKGEKGQYRTPGGIFLHLVKSIPQRYGVDPEEVKKVMKDHKKSKESENKLLDKMEQMMVK